ncbi:hypothetical protein ACLBV9_04545 [Staphylococcus succinus]|uniref:hypothetical protein n=1 Tax=Staphylococcus succinus TaxID=61015 RepID=UPI0012EB7ED6|nr:hypothetical protein [Staphylococcus succinus]MBU0438709.1 hypothetical protein [Staphylococcus succinus]MEB8127587.1 hypothetical protein [Staphylococcus succinus]MEB8210415.1 hypothetical protein [Staphylococcus succinus]
MKKIILLLFVGFTIVKSYNDESRELKLKIYTNKYNLIPFSIRLSIQKHSFEGHKLNAK